MEEMELPPVFEQLIQAIGKDRKKLLRTKTFEDPAQLRAFVGQYLYPRMIDVIRLLAGGFMESYGLSVSNTNELRRLHYFTVERLREVGADVSDQDDASLPGVSPAVLDDFQHAFYAIGTAIQKEASYAELQECYDRCASFVGDMVGELMNGYDDIEEDDPEGDDEGDEAATPSEDAPETPAEPEAAAEDAPVSTEEAADGE